MATYQGKKLETAQAVARAKARAPPSGPLLLTAALSLTCFLVSDYLLYSDVAVGCDGEQGAEEASFLRRHLWTAQDGWMCFTLSRLLLSGIVFVVFCVGFACILGCCGYKAAGPTKQISSPI